MKKLLILISFIALAFGVNAQDYYRYSFWSNWSIGGGLQYTKEFNNNWTIGEGSNFGFELRGEKQLNDCLKLRIIGSAPGIFTSDTNQFDRYLTGLVGISWSPCKHFYLFADGGMAVKRAQYGWLALAADAGVGVEFEVYDNSFIYSELGLDCVADITSNMTYDNVFLKVGWKYYLGITKNDEMILEQRALLQQMKEQENTTQMDSLANCLGDCQRNEKELIKRIEILENHDYALTTRIGELSNYNDSLANIINSIKDNQLNYYALPFSVLFDNDSYTINDSERGKIKAIASIMKDDTTVHYSVVGFCDKTGSQEYNKRLSIKRAEAVKKALIRLGVKEEQITVDGNGYDRPFSNGRLEVNRRVSFYRNF